MTQAKTALDRVSIVLHAMFSNIPLDVDGQSFWIKLNEEGQLSVCTSVDVEYELDDDDDLDADFVEVDFDLADFLRTIQTLDDDYLLELQANTLLVSSGLIAPPKAGTEFDDD